jgi:iron complex transport system ATP-binding protein
MLNSFQFKNLSVGYSHKPLIENISLQVQSPCLVGLIGNNGIGKTTLLKTICGLQPKISGSVLYNQQEITTLTNKELSTLLSFGFSSANYTFPVSVFELVSMGRYPYLNNMASLTNTDKEIILQFIETLAISHLKDKLITQISDGERQKATIAKVLAQLTPVLLLDEPTAFLDYTSKKQFFNIMKQVAQERNSIIIVSSHDIDFLTRYADYLLMITDDKKNQFDTTQNIITNNYFKQHFNY